MDPDARVNFITPRALIHSSCLASEIKFEVRQVMRRTANWRDTGSFQPSVGAAAFGEPWRPGLRAAATWAPSPSSSAVVSGGRRHLSAGACGRAELTSSSKRGEEAEPFGVKF